MHHTIAHLIRNFSLVAAASVALLSGCGDAGMFSRGEFRGPSEANLGAKMSAEDVRIEYRSTRCDEYAETACPEGEAPAIEVHVESRSIIFDFSNIEEAGEIADVHFEGFVIEVIDVNDSEFLLATIDENQSNLAIDPRALTYGDHYLQVNLAGVDFDSGGFLKVDLLVGPLNPLAGGG